MPGEASVQKKQATLGMFQAKTCPPARANTITILVAEFVSRDLHPIFIVDGKGFQQLLATWNQATRYLHVHMSPPHVVGFIVP